MTQVIPAVDDTLTPDDASKLADELMEAQSDAYMLGIALGLKTCEVQSTLSTYQQPKDKLFQIIFAFLRQTEPLPTWRAVVKALNSPSVSLPRVAKKIEAKYINRPTPTLPCQATSASPMTRRPLDNMESRPYDLRGKREQNVTFNDTDLGAPEPKRKKREPGKDREEAKEDLIQKEVELREALMEFLNKDEEWKTESKKKLDNVQEQKKGLQRKLSTTSGELKKVKEEKKVSIQTNKAFSQNEPYQSLEKETKKLTKDYEQLEMEQNSLNEVLATERITLTKTKEELVEEKSHLIKQNKDLKILSKKLSDQNAIISKQKEDAEKRMQSEMIKKDQYNTSSRTIAAEDKELEELKHQLTSTQNELNQKDKQLQSTQRKCPCSIL